MSLSKEEIQQARLNCLSEWDSVNDPPCHPSDADWRPCPICDPSKVRAVLALKMSLGLWLSGIFYGRKKG